MNLFLKEAKTYGGHFDKETKEKRIQELEEMTKKETFWQNMRKSAEVIEELNN